MTTFARPGTPFPHTHALHHSTSSSSYTPIAQQSYFTSRPIHFVPRQLPARTPPSLLNRQSSSSSSSSSSSLRRQDSISTSSSEDSVGSPIIQTPILEVEEIESTPMALTLPSPLLKRGFALPPPEYNWTEKAITDETDFDIHSSSFDWCPKKLQSTSPSRPSLKRKDTPRPELSILPSLNASSHRTLAERRGSKRLTSMIDGGAWIVIDEE